MEYTDARENLAAALRKAPPNGAVAFRAIATKWLIVVHLLLGDIPERSLFAGGGGPSASKIQSLLKPYLLLAMAVRSGDLEAFGTAAAKFHDVFVADGVAKLVVRLRRSVIRTGLRRIHLTYSRISLADGTRYRTLAFLFRLFFCIFFFVVILSLLRTPSFPLDICEHAFCTRAYNSLFSYT